VLLSASPIDERSSSKHMPQNRRRAARSFWRICDQVAERWTLWRLVRWCSRLSRADAREFDQLVSQMSAMRTPDKDTVRDTSGPDDAIRQPDDRLAAAIAELRLEERILLHLLVHGVSCHEVSVALQISDERVRHELKAVLCRLADVVHPPDLSHVE